eukprot:9285947-Pyramimonas_sp.AAC.1
MRVGCGKKSWVKRAEGERKQGNEGKRTGGGGEDQEGISGRGRVEWRADCSDSGDPPGQARPGQPAVRSSD